MAAANRRDVILNIYDLTDEHGTGSWLRAVGMGMYHTGVEISGAEYTFGPNGVFFHLPKKPGTSPGQSVKLRDSMIMGTHVGSANEVSGIINRLRDTFPPGSYHQTSRNCNHWSDALCRALVDKPIPKWINRPANIASFGGCENELDDLGMIDDEIEGPRPLETRRKVKSLRRGGNVPITSIEQLRIPSDDQDDDAAVRPSSSKRQRRRLRSLSSSSSSSSSLSTAHLSCCVQ